MTKTVVSREGSSGIAAAKAIDHDDEEIPEVPCDICPPALRELGCVQI